MTKFSRKICNRSPASEMALCFAMNYHQKKQSAFPTKDLISLENFYESYQDNEVFSTKCGRKSFSRRKSVRFLAKIFDVREATALIYIYFNPIILPQKVHSRWMLSTQIRILPACKDKYFICLFILKVFLIKKITFLTFCFKLNFVVMLF